MDKHKRELASVIRTFYVISLVTVFFVFKWVSNYYLFFLFLSFAFFIDLLIVRLFKTPKKAPSKKAATTRTKARTDEEIIKAPLKDLSGREFERLCYLYFKAKGYRPRETKNGADGGVDLIIYNRYHKTEEAIQIKHYFNSQNRITVKEIRELHAAKRNHQCVLASFITSSTYTKEALKQADQFKITCKDINWINRTILKWKEQQQRKLG